jgi:hypothetical protein
MSKAVYASLQAVQRELKAPKGQFNSFGNYKYRSCEDIVEAVKPLLNENGLILTMSDDVVEIGDYYYKKDGDGTVEIRSKRVYIKATASVIDVATGDKIEVSALAREPEEKKKMDTSQITGTASSFARKYALNGLFAIDDTKDADTDAYAIQNAQNDAQATEKKNKGKSTNKDSKPLYNEADAVRKANINKLNAEIKRLGAKPEDVKNLAEFNFKKKSVNDMSDTEICVLTENLEKWLKGE